MGACQWTTTTRALLCSGAMEHRPKPWWKRPPGKPSITCPTLPGHWRGCGLRQSVSPLSRTPANRWQGGQSYPDRQASVRARIHVHIRWFRSPWQRYVMLLVLFVSRGMLIGFADAGEHARPVRIGALTSSWGPSPQVVGLRDGLVELGYREYEHFILGLRFTA